VWVNLALERANDDGGGRSRKGRVKSQQRGQFGGEQEERLRPLLDESMADGDAARRAEVPEPAADGLPLEQ
jgi:hypothetical protein